jgi:hypothetical protein
VGFRWNINGSGGAAELYLTVAVPSGSRNMDLWVNNQWVANVATTASESPRPNGGELGPFLVNTVSGTNVVELRDIGSGSAEFDVHQLRVVEVASNLSYLIEAEDYGSESGTDTEPTTDTGGGLNVGWLEAEDWLAYPLAQTRADLFGNLPAGTYLIEYRVASLPGGGSFDLRSAPEGGSSVFLGSRSVPATGDWQAWITISHTISWSGGAFSPRITATGPGWNINWFRITAQ